jgi:hypothetical protein
MEGIIGQTLGNKYMKTLPARSFALLVSFALFGVAVRAAHPLDHWELRTVPRLPDENSVYGLESVAFGNGTFVAVSWAGFILRSTDGTVWTDTTPPIPRFHLQRIRFLNGQFTVVGWTNLMLRSPDGANWTSTVVPRNYFGDVGYGNGRYVIAGISMFSSTNTVDWTQGTTDLNQSGFQSVVFGQGKFMASCINISSPADGIATSVDGQNWIMGPPLPSQTKAFSYLMFEQGQWVLAHRNAAQIYSSRNGTNWIQSSGLPADYVPWGAVAYGAGHFVTVSRALAPGGFPATFGFFSSTNAVVWERRFPNPNAAPSETDFSPLSVTFGKGRFVAVGNGSICKNVYVSDVLESPPLLQIDRNAEVEIFGLASRSYRIEAAPGIDGPWQTVTNIILPRSPYRWSDFDFPAPPTRLFRVIELP